jgi:hypothetical protein
MRLIIGLALILGGFGLCLVDTLAEALASGYYEQVRAFPEKQSYTKAEVTDAFWKVWTNRMALHDTSYDRHQFKREIQLASGHGYRGGSALTAVGVLLMLVGAFVLGVSVQLRKEPKRTTEE